MRQFPLTVLQDCNEVGHGTHYTFQGIKADAERGGGPLHIPTSSANLYWGDYSLAGHEKDVVVERKTLSDLFGTLGSGRQHFKEQVEAMSSYKMAAVAIEASWDDIVRRPPSYSKMSPKCVQRTILSWWSKWPTVAWFCWQNRRLCEVLTFRLLERYFLNQLPEREQRRFRYPPLPPLG